MMIFSLRYFCIRNMFLKPVDACLLKYCQSKPDYKLIASSVLNLNRFSTCTSIKTTNSKHLSKSHKQFCTTLIIPPHSRRIQVSVANHIDALRCNSTAESFFKNNFQGQELVKRAYHTGSTGLDSDFIFRQFLEYKSYTFSYLLADLSSREAVIIDPVIDTVERDLKFIKDFNLNLVYGLNTHVHADHITGTGEMKKYLPGFHSVIADASGAKADVKIKDGEFIKFGQYQLQALATPGHTDGCMTFVWHEKAMVFTGDALLIRGCGRTDFQQGDAGTLYDSVHNKIFTLPEHFCVFPAHDYTGQTVSTVAEEKKFNPRLTKPKPEFIEVMQKLNLPYPKQIDVALPANLMCGVFDIKT